MFRTILAAAFAAAGLAATAGAQGLPERPQPVAEVLILGTYHFANPGRDMYNAEADNVLAPHRQAEIADLVDALVAFEPTIVAVEAGPESAVNERYAAWRRGEAELTANETQQIGFRLAGRFGLDRVAPVDADYPFMSEADMAIDDSDPHVAALDAASHALGAGFVAENEARQRTHTIGEMLAWMNAPETLNANSDFYLAYGIRRWGADGNPGGAHTVANWYTRNILIFQNILRELEGRQGERVVLVIGQGHAPILRYLVEASPLLTLADPLDYLPDVPEAPEVGTAD